MRAARIKRSLSGERGFTLAELVAGISILSILVAIAVVIILGILEQRRVDAATKQLVSDMRLAHVNATNQLTDWRVVILLDRAGESEGPDYFLLKLRQPYGEGVVPVADQSLPRTFPGDVKANNVVTQAGSLVDDREGGYWLAPWDTPPSEPVETRTVEFNPDGTMKFYRAASGSICVTQDGNPQNRAVALAATSRLLVEDDSRCDTSAAGGG